MSPAEKVISIARDEVGYLEKKSNKSLDHKTENAGNNNYTKYARDVYPSLQAQAWCDIFVDWCFIKAFNKIDAKILLCGGFSAYTPTSAQYYKDKGRWITGAPAPGDQIFFKNTTRINHTGIVSKVSNGTVYTIEGNTSSGKDVIANGGAVCEKSYPINHSRIAGYGRPDWTILDKYEVGWHKDSVGWWYADTKNSYYANKWVVINNHKYYFNKDGYAISGWQIIDGKKYFFEKVSGHPFECALYVTDENGAQGPGLF